VHYTNYKHHNYNCNYTTQLQLHYTTLHPAVVVGWALQPLQPLQKSQVQPPFGPSVDSLCHPWFTTTNLSYRFPILKLSPPPCAVLLEISMNHEYMYQYINIYTHIYIYAFIYIYIFTFIYIYIYTNTQTHKHTYIYIYICAWYKYIYIYRYMI